MALALNPGVSFCLVGTRAIFFDRRRDRYRAINATQTAAFLAGNPFKVLLDSDLVKATDDDTRPQPCSAPRATRDLFCREAARLRLADAVQAGLASALARLILATGGLDRMLRGLERRTSTSWQVQDLEVIENQALRFNRARPWVPISAVCLVDSLALMLFLAWRGCAATLVFGVEIPPFTAHAWVQSGDCVLNDAVERIVVYTPILAVGS
ncbi:lasso peptide biosynthesis B2 protein [Caulobacter segnis]|uniref:Lasso peptide biosynthesis B2 protein n=1 Tax=Caulobacter segnis TaxID=88688 RepID=A0A2W5VFY8_9CAUL|nr:lasso peptide biosynthesis B2 protein [Caulobacter segnis]PZR35486.1 MAG: lasso peptide biosynthesis B2 protein [Caulobacter segnis]